MFGLDTTETIFSLAIAIIYPFFFTKLTNLLVDHDNISPMCGGYASFWYSGSFDRIESEDDKFKRIKKEQCWKEREAKLDHANFKQHVMLIIISFIGILGASAIQTHSTKVGVGLGGIFTLIAALMMFWYKYNETVKLVILGLSLAALMFLSVKLYSVQNISDLFSLIEFGTK